MIARDRLPAVIVNPSTPIGPRDVRPTPTGRIIVEAASGRMPAFVDTGLNLAHVDDVAAGHLAALERGADRRALYSWRRQCLPRRHAGRHRPPRRASAADGQAAAHPALSARLWSGGAGEAQRRRAVPHDGRLADGAPPDVLRRLQGASESWAMFRGPIARALRTRSPGFARTALSNDSRRRLRLPGRDLGLSPVRQGMVLALRRARRLGRPSSCDTRSKRGRASWRSSRRATRPI